MSKGLALWSQEHSHGVFCAVRFPTEEPDQHGCSKKEGYENVGRMPGVLISTPLHAHHEQQLHRHDQQIVSIMTTQTVQLTIPPMDSKPPT